MKSTARKNDATAPPVLGARYKCYKCGTKFYDLGKPEPLCPSCGEDQNNEETRRMLRRKKKRRPSSTARPDAAVPVPEERDDTVDMHEEEGEYSPDIDDIVLEEDAESNR